MSCPYTVFWFSGGYKKLSIQQIGLPNIVTKIEAPSAGLGPATARLTAECSTN